jgi:hypothetical protein
MKCPKCGYVSHDYLDACCRCSIDLVGFKNEIGLMVLEPGYLDLGILVNGNGMSANGNGGEYDDSSDYLGTSMMVETEEIGGREEEDVDIRLDDDVVNAMPTTNKAPGSLTREFFVPDELLADADKEAQVDDHGTAMDAGATHEPDTLSNIAQQPVTEEILNLDFDDETISSETFFTESVTSDSTDVIDMNAVQELRDAYSEPEDVDVEEIEPDIEADDLSGIDMNSVSLDLDDTLLEEDATVAPSDPNDSQSNMILDEFAEFDLQDTAADDVSDADSAQQEDAAVELPNDTGSLALPDDFQLGDFEVDEVEQEDAAVEPPDDSGSLALPDDFQLGDFDVDEAQQEDAAVEPPNDPGNLALPDDFQLGDGTLEETAAVDQSDVVPTAPAESDHAQPQSEPLPQPKSEKITLSFPIDPNTETLFFDQLSDSFESDATSEQEPSGDSESPSDALIEAESTLELDMELELPASEPIDEEEATEIPIDTELSNSDNNKAQP